MVALPVLTHCHHRRTGLAIPPLKGTEILPIGIGHGINKIVAGDGLAVMALKIQIHAFSEPGFTQHAIEHADHFGTFVVHRNGVEVVHFHHFLRADGVRHGATVFSKLHRLDDTCFTDPGCRRARPVGTELLITKHRQAFFEAELEPVPAGDPVTGPVVKVFVGNNAGNIVVVTVGGRIVVSQDVLGVKQIQAFVFHGAHVEEVHRDNHVAVQVVFQTVVFFVPLHRGLEASHGVSGLQATAFINVYFQQYITATGRSVMVAQAVKVTGHQGKQVARLGKRVVPGSKMAATVQIATVNEIAVGEQLRVTLLITNHLGGINSQYIGAILEIGDAAEAFGFTLRAKGTTGFIQTFQSGVSCRVNFGDDRQLSAVCVNIQHQLAGIKTRLNGFAVDFQCQ